MFIVHNLLITLGQTVFIRFDTKRLCILEILYLSRSNNTARNISPIGKQVFYAMHQILVIDDEKSILDIFQQALSRSGCKVEIASDVTEGIKKFDDGLFDLVITDILIHGRSGNDIVQHVRNSDRQFTPVIGISGTPWLLKDGDFDMVFTKPLSLKKLVDAVHDLSSTSSKAIAYL